MSISIQLNDSVLEAFALMCEVGGMNAENQQRGVLGQAVAYDDTAYFDVAEKIRALKDGEQE
jgi:hypothetical protein